MQLLVFIFLCIVWGTTWIAIKITLEGLPPFFGASLRFLVALTLLFIYIKIKGISIRPTKRDFRIIFASSLLMYTFDYGLVYWGEQYLSAGVTAIFFATFPIFTGVWATFLFRNEKFSWTKSLGLLLGFSGILIVFYDQLVLADFSKMVVLASLAIVTGAAGGAMAVVIVKKHLSMVNPISLTFNQMLYGMASLLFFALIFESPAEIQINLRVGLAILYLGMVGSAIAFALYYWLLRQLSAITLSLIIYITPIVALVVDYWVFGELIHIRAVIGTVIIFSGVALTQSRMNRSLSRKKN